MTVPQYNVVHVLCPEVTEYFGFQTKTRGAVHLGSFFREERTRPALQPSLDHAHQRRRT